MRRFILCTLILALSATVNAEVKYNVFDLGIGIPNAINNNGQIVGYDWNTGAYRAVLYDATGHGNNKILGPGTAYSINNAGQIVGTNNVNKAILFDATGNGNNRILGTGVAQFNQQ